MENSTIRTASESMQILENILDIGVALIESGAETWRTEDTVYRLAAGYGFTKCNFWVVPSNIQATVTDRDGNCLTQIRHVRNSGIDFDKLDKLNSLSRYAVKNVPPSDTLREKLQQIRNAAPIPAWLHYLAGALGGGAFGFFFHCDLMDAVTAVLAALLITFLSRLLKHRERNPLILNFIISFLVEIFIIGAVYFRLGHHTGYITMGVVMLLISALGATNGVRDMVHLDTLSGIMKLTESLTGAAGIVLGIGFPLFLFRFTESNEIITASPAAWIQITAATVGCVGFALWFGVRRSKVIYCALGACLTWAAYLVVHSLIVDSVFIASLISTIVCAIYSQVIARIVKAPFTIFQTVSIFPLIPGSALYYLMYGILIRDRQLAFSKGAELVIVCAGIVLGLMAVEVLVKIIFARRGKKM